MICIYHNRDLDGFTSGAIVKYWFDQLDELHNGEKETLKLIGYDYGQPIPWDAITKDEKVIMVDVSFKMEDMLRLAEYSGWKFIWIDHHISAINDYNQFVVEDEKIHGHFLTPVLENGISACRFSLTVSNGRSHFIQPKKILIVLLWRKVKVGVVIKKQQGFRKNICMRYFQ